jgi:hypothetical protein
LDTVAKQRFPSTIRKSRTKYKIFKHCLPLMDHNENPTRLQRERKNTHNYTKRPSVSDFRRFRLLLFFTHTTSQRVRKNTTPLHYTHHVQNLNLQALHFHILHTFYNIRFDNQITPETPCSTTKHTTLYCLLHHPPIIPSDASGDLLGWLVAFLGRLVGVFWSSRT